MKVLIEFDTIIIYIEISRLQVTDLLPNTFKETQTRSVENSIKLD